MNATQSKQVLSIAQEAIAMLPHAASFALRVRLEQAIASPVASKAKSGKISKKATPYKPIKSLMAHVFQGTIDADGNVDRPDLRDTSCMCAGCQIDRGFFERGRNREVSNMANDAPHFDKAAVIAKLDKCACGHDADSHDKDDLENLLQCHGLMLPDAGMGEPCDCERFHYDVDAEAA